jgi:DNA-directed RNA polymerase subunit RPC12/RpoP
MNYPVVCEFCGGSRLRRSRRKSAAELVKMAIGTYPFRCMDCNGRFFVNVFLLSRLAYAKCPRCLSLDIRNSPNKNYRASLPRKVLMTFGARPCRCNNCRYGFVSFRPIRHGQPFEPAVAAEDEAESEVAAPNEPKTSSELN